METTEEHHAIRSAIQKGLFVTFEGLPPTIADSQVVTHIEEMAKLGIEFELWVFAVTPQKCQNATLRSKDLIDIKKITTKVFRAVRPAIPFSEIINSGILGFNLWKYKNKFDFIHARTDYAAAVCGLLKWFYKPLLIWDCRGDTKTEFLAKYKPQGFVQKLLAAYKIFTLDIRRSLSAKTCDKAIVVSQKLFERVGKGVSNKQFMIIPSLASSDYFYLDIDLRKKRRRELGIKNNEILLIFSGSITEYQSFPEQIEFFEKIRQKNTRYKLIVLTPDIEKAKVDMVKLPAESYWLKKVPYSEVNSWLNAADLALFIRKHDEFNTPVSPLKFAEYCLAGLRIIMTDAVEQSFRIAKELDNLCYYDFFELPTNMEPLDKLSRERIAKEAKEKISKSSHIEKYLSLYGR